MCKNKKECTCNCKVNINESIVLLQEKINLQLTSNYKKELLKQTKIALDALMSVYDISEKANINRSDFLNLVDDAFSNTNEILTILVVQETIENK